MRDLRAGDDERVRARLRVRVAHVAHETTVAIEWLGERPTPETRSACAHLAALVDRVLADRGVAMTMRGAPFMLRRRDHARSECAVAQLHAALARLENRLSD